MNPRVRRSIWVVLIAACFALVWLQLTGLADRAEQNQRAADAALESVDILADQLTELGAVPRVDPSDLPTPDPGPQGIPGLTGPMGPPGPVGATGPQGDKGNRGVFGADGSDGSDGSDGAQGPAGPQGDQGPQGPAGTDGQNGQDGADGKDGAAGADALPFTFSFVIPGKNPAELDVTYVVTCAVDGCTVGSS